MSKFRFMLLGTAAVGLTAAAMSTASAGEVTKTAAVSGHVMRAVNVGTDGSEGFVRLVDNNSSSSRIRGTVSAASESLTIGATLELGAYVARSTVMTSDNTSSNSVGMRQSVVTVSNNMGSVMIGQGWHPNDTMADVNVSGTGNASLVDGGGMAAVAFYDKSTGGLPAAGPLVSAAYGAKTHSLRNGISYTTPNFNGLSATVAHTSGASGQIGASYNADYDGTAVTFGGAWGDTSGADVIDRTWGLGLGVTLANGLNVSLGYGKDEKNNNTATGGTTSLEDSTQKHGVIGYKMTGLSDMGGTNFAIGYALYQDQDTTASNSDEMKKYWVAVEQALTDYGTTVYAAYDHYTYDTNTANYDDIKGGTVGIKVLF